MTFAKTFKLFDDMFITRFDRDFTRTCQAAAKHEVVRAGQGDFRAIGHRKDDEFCMEIIVVLVECLLFCGNHTETDHHLMDAGRVAPVVEVNVCLLAFENTIEDACRAIL